MGILKRSLRPVARSDNELREASRRVREDCERQNAMLRAALAAKSAAGVDDGRWLRGEQDRERLGAQMACLEARTFTIPRLDTILTLDTHHRRESSRFAGSLRVVEELELGRDRVES